MHPLNFPQYPFRLRNTAGRTQVFDEIRKRWVALTPEEWVRQHAVQFLVRERSYPASLIAVEMIVQLNGMNKRCDVLAHGRNAQPLLLVECKAPEVPITQEVFDQIARYNLCLGVPFLLVTNGLRHFCCSMDHEKQSYVFLPEVPVLK